MLPFTAIRRQLDRLAVGAEKGLVDVQHSLDRILARRHFLQRPTRIALGVIADSQGRVGFSAVHRYAENHLRFRRIVDLHPWLSARIIGEQEQQTPVERPRRASVPENEP